MAVFRAVMPLATNSSRYALGYRYVVATAEVTIHAGVVTTVNTAAGGTASGSCTLASVVFTVARTLSEGSAGSLVIENRTGLSLARTVSFQSVIRGRVDGQRLCLYDDTLTPSGEPVSYLFHMVHFGLVGNVFDVGNSTEVSDGAIGASGGLRNRWYNNVNWIGLPVIDQTAMPVVVSGTVPVGVNTNGYISATWFGYIRLPNTGGHQFRVRSDDNCRITVGGLSPIDTLWTANAWVYSGQVPFTAAVEKLFSVQWCEIRGVPTGAATGAHLDIEIKGPSTSDVWASLNSAWLFVGGVQSVGLPVQATATHYVQAVNRYLEA